MTSGLCVIIEVDVSSIKFNYR